MPSLKILTLDRVSQFERARTSSHASRSPTLVLWTRFDFVVAFHRRIPVYCLRAGALGFGALLAASLLAFSSIIKFIDISTMPLVSYSDSEDSDPEAKLAVQPIAKSITGPSKPAFQKVVDRSNPHKITVHLPEASKGLSERLDTGQEPPSKRARLGAGSFGDFNSLLPAPKRTTTNITGNGSSSRGVGLKTGAAPGFSRDTQVAADAGIFAKEGLRVEDADSSAGGQGPKPSHEEDIVPQKEEKSDSPKKGGRAMFKPLSVARKPKKKKPDRAEDAAIARSMGAASTDEVARVTKASLFSIDSESGTKVDRHGLEGEYRPMIHGSIQSPGGPTEDSDIGHNPPENLETSVDGTENPIVTSATFSFARGLTVFRRDSSGSEPLCIRETSALWP